MQITMVLEPHLVSLLVLFANRLCHFFPYLAPSLQRNMEVVLPFLLASLLATAKALIPRFSSFGPIVHLEHAKYQDYYDDSYGLSI